MQPTAIAEQTAEEGQQDREHDRHDQADDQHRVVDSKFRQNEDIIWVLVNICKYDLVKVPNFKIRID